VFSSGLQVTGMLATILKDEYGEAAYFRTKGPTALSLDNKQLDGHGKETHRKGFGTPIGSLEDGIVLEDCSKEQLQDLGIIEEQTTILKFQSGVRVAGTVKSILSSEGKPILISFKECSVTYKEKVLFESSWGTFDMAVGAKVISVFAGAADPNRYYDFPPIEEVEEIAPQKSWNELETLYEEIRSFREGTEWKEQSIAQVLAILEDRYPKEWLLRLEILELYKKHDVCHPHVILIEERLQTTDWDSSVKQMIQRGLTLIHNS